MLIIINDNQSIDINKKSIIKSNFFCKKASDLCAMEGGQPSGWAKPLVFMSRMCRVGNWSRMPGIGPGWVGEGRGGGELAKKGTSFFDIIFS